MIQKLKKKLSVIFALSLLLQILPTNFSFAVTPSDLTGTVHLTVHSTDYTPSSQASSLEITEADGTTVINPDASGNYSDIPSGAKIVLDYAFSLEDGDAGHTVTYNYDGNEYFTADLPSGLNFAATSGTIVANDTADGNYDLATWSISGSALTVELTSALQDTYGHDGAANPSHLNKWGKIHIEGTFQPLNAGDGTAEQITFGSQTIIINRLPLPMKSTIAKSGSYDASTNQITWTVTVTPPAGAPGMAYDDYSVIDEFGSNQTYVADSFVAGGVSVTATDAALAIDIPNRKITYTFPDTTPDTTGIQTITYKTAPTDFSAENGTSAEASTYSNTVNLKRGVDLAADPATSSVNLNWMNKTGAMVDTSAADPTITKWTVDVTVPGESGKSITGAAITDTIPSDFELLADASHPVSIQFGSAAATDVTSGGSDGQYSYAGNVLTYRFLAGSQPTAGTTAKLTFYTKVTAASWSTYLNSNGGILVSNSASLNWSETTALTSPSDRYTISNGIGSGGLLSKSAGAASNYAYSVLDPGTIHWTITVNRNKVSMVNAIITDIVPTGQALLIDATHAFKITEQVSGIPMETITTAASSGNFTYTDANHFLYEFPEEAAGTDTINSTYTVDYYTQIVDPSGLATLYRNGTVGLTNGVTLTRTGETNVSSTGTKNYFSQMVSKSVATAYNYNDRTVQWQIVVNRNKLPLTNAVLTDSMPSGMTLLVDGTHPFSITALGGGWTGTLMGANGDTSFTITLPTPTTDQYTLTFWTKMSEDTLETQWSGTRDFTNSASLDSDEITAPITATNKVSIYNPVVSKTYNYVSGSDTINWSVVINPAQVLLQNAAVTDVLNASLQLDPASVKLYTVSINSATGAVASTLGAVDAADYTVTLPTTDNGNELTVELPANTSLAYRLDFSTAILTDDINLTNSVSLSGSAGDSTGSTTSNQIIVNNLYSSGGSGTNSLYVHKTDSLANPLAGATFRLLNVNKQPITSGGSQITRTTDASGDALFSNLPSWVFYVEEIDPAPGYLIPSNPIFGGGRLVGTETINVTNSLALTSVSFSKLDANGITLLSGGTFALTGNDYALNSVNKAASAVNGVVTFTNVAPNKVGEPYTITETTAPAGYNLNGATISAIVAYNADKSSLVVTVTPNTLLNTQKPSSGGGSSEPYAAITVMKIDEEGNTLSGAEFTLFDNLNNIVAKAISGADGIAQFGQVAKATGYTIKEIKAPDGYELNSKIISFSVSSDAPQTFTITDKKITEHLGSINILKTDTSGKTLAGAEFTLYDTNGKSVESVITKSDGTAKFSNIPAGSYTINETRAPLGYIAASNGTSVNISSGAAISLTFKNIAAEAAATETGKVQIVKVDKDYHPLAGAELTLFNGKGDVIRKAISGNDGIITFDHLAPGKYSIQETIAPEGYKLFSKSLEFQIVDTESSKSFTLTNTQMADDNTGVAGWSNDNGANGGKLPKTGGISATFFILLAGLGSLFIGLILLSRSKYNVTLLLKSKNNN